MTRKKRLLYLAWTPPSTQGGACLAMHRHFVLHDDFEVFVASSNVFTHPNLSSLHIQRHPLLKRLSDTRFCRLVRQFEMLVEPSWALKQVEPILEQFQPDAIFTVPDNTISWTAYLLSKKTGLPLITNFQDWWPRGQFTLDLERPYSFVASLLETRFKQLYEHSSLAFCTSAGMKQKLGEHHNAPVLYPCPASRDLTWQPDFQPPPPHQPIRIIYAGTIINAYGRSVLALAKALRENKEFEFHVYGPNPDWPAADRQWMEEEGIYRGLLSYDELKLKLREADACLAVMSFEPQLRLMMETSFTTKFLEYSQYGKPIVVWGPEYCQPIRVAQAEGFALPVTSPDVASVVAALDTLKTETCWKTLAHGAWQAANSSFDPEKIHELLKLSIQDVLS